MKNVLLMASLIMVSPITQAQDKYAGDFDNVVWGTQALDVQRTLRDLKPLAKRGDIFSQYLLGEMYQVGQGVEQDNGQAALWYRQSAEQGFARAQFKLSQLLALGIGVAADKGEAMVWARKAAQQGCADAQFILGYLLRSYAGAQQEAIFWMRKAAWQGDPIHQYRLAKIYEPKSESSDKRRAFFWMRKAARQHLAQAEYMTGSYYQYGHGTPIDIERALYWYHRASAQGSYRAAEAIGDLYDSDRWGRKEPSAALEWNCKAGHLGSEHALPSLLKYPGGEACLLEIANDGYAAAQRELGLAHESRKQPEVAVAWYRKSAVQGDVLALEALVTMYAKGTGVPRDWVVATALYNIRYPGFEGRVTPSEVKQLSDEQKEEARLLARAWKLGMPLPEESRTGR